MSTQLSKDNPFLRSTLKNVDASSAEVPLKDTVTSNPLLIKTELRHNPSTETTATISATISATTDKNQNKSETAQNDFSVDYDIPTLDDIALPGEIVPTLGTRVATPSGQPIGATAESSADINEPGAIPIPRHILNSKPTNNDQSFSPEFIDKLAADLQEILIPEIEKSINFAFNNALASAMDQASKITKSTINKRIRDLIPELLKQHLQNIPKNDLLK